MRTSGRPELHRLIFNAALERSEVAFASVWGRLLPILQRIAFHLSEYIAKGALRDVDPVVAARLIIGAAIYHYQLYELFGGRKVPAYSQADLSVPYSDIIFRGLKAQP